MKHQGPALFTSRYAAGQLIIASGLIPVRTSIGGPRFRIPYKIEGICRLLMPTRDIMGVPGQEGRYLYYNVLEESGVDTIRRDFQRISDEAGGRGLVLLCFEDLAKSSCHRRLFADWWETQTGQAVPELSAAEAHSCGA